MKFLNLLILYVLIFFYNDFYAQETFNGSLGLRRIYQSTLINPVLIPDSTTVENSVSILPVDFGGNIEIGALNLGTITSSIHGGVLNLNSVIDGMKNSKNSNLFAGANMSLMHVYLKVGKKGSRIEISQRFKTSAATNMVSKNVLAVFFEESDNTNPTVSNLTNSKIRAMGWSEIAMGYTSKIGKKWNLGGKLKYLTGVAYASFYSSKLIVTAAQNGNSFDINSKIRTSSLNPIVDKAYNQDLTPYKNDVKTMMVDNLTKNIGFAADFGIGYTINKQTKAFAGFNDLGYINWGNNPLTYNTVVTLTDFYPIKYDYNTKKYDLYLDPIINNGTAQTNSFKTSLNTQLNAGITYQPVKWFHTTILADAYIADNTFSYPGATVAGTLNGGDFSEFTMNAGYNKDRPFRIGMGMSMKLKVLQMHLFSNNIIGAFDASKMRSADLQFGLSWVWKNKVPKPVQYDLNQG
ncbi:DUF5723 family protein [Flavobacterium sp. HJJ]|uniref:DUF5723 family protein n=1 Tax=Flavobacterium sp. HJJ TaxID=2783792 RepID=UPI00188B0DFF|nr:DUF5723 family protein [Flavobacterium sp. HJJ]MBF4471203.1 hypothetical protein [Flavobacterium sp. HJJ]